MKVSIIIPIYNSEKYLRQCIDSILNQTYQDIEILLIDDGSIDNSPIICDEYQVKDDRIKVIHKENGGVTSTWKLGLQIATGEYLAFVDSDDYVSPNYIKHMVDSLEDDSIGLIAVNAIRDENGKLIKLKINELEGIHDVDDYIFENLLYIKNSIKKLIANTRWCKLIKKEIAIKAAEYCSNEVSIGDDFQLVAGVILHCKRIKSIDCYDYYYRNNENSLINTYKKDLWNKSKRLCEVFSSYRKIWKSNNIDEQINTVILEYVVMSILQELNRGKEGKRIIKEIMNDQMTINALQCYYKKAFGIYSSLILRFVRIKSIMPIRFINWLYLFYNKININLII